MNELEQDRSEAELRRTSPAPLPADFMARLQAAKPAVGSARRTLSRPADASPAWWRALRWLAPAMAVAVAGLLVVKANLNPARNVGKKPLAVAYRLKADEVQLDQELVSTFDVVATLPGGQPVRFRCREWNDQLIMTDKSHGVEIEQNSPRVEVVPVRFETY